MPPKLTMTVGPRPGAEYPLDALRETTIGRGTECGIILTDPLSSRVHALLQPAEQGWRLRDLQSRNGTFLNGQSITESLLTEGSRLRIGSTEFLFTQATDSSAAMHATHNMTIVRNSRVHTGQLSSSAAHSAAIMASSGEPLAEGPLASAEPLSGAGPPEGNSPTAALELDLQALELAAGQLLSAHSQRDLLQGVAAILARRFGAKSAVVLMPDDEGHLLPWLSIGNARATPPLSPAMVQMVLHDQHAVWLASEAASGGSAAGDAICVPLPGVARAQAALLIQLEQGRFRQSHFDLAIRIAALAAVALGSSMQGNSTSNHPSLGNPSLGSPALGNSLWSDTAPGAASAGEAAKGSPADTATLALTADSPAFVGNSAAAQQIRQRIEQLATAPLVLISGPLGSGKRLAARLLHQMGHRAQRDLLRIDCEALLSGREDSWASSATTTRPTSCRSPLDSTSLSAWFDEAQLATLLIEAVDRLPLAVQDCLARLLPRQAAGLGPRVILTTSVDLSNANSAARLSPALYKVLQPGELALVALLRRREDIPLLVAQILSQLPGNLVCSPAALDQLSAHAWPGNVAQLKALLRSVVLGLLGSRAGQQPPQPQLIEPADLPLSAFGPAVLDTLELATWERRLVSEALLRSNNHVPEAAGLLGMARATLYRKIEEYGIER